MDLDVSDVEELFQMLDDGQAGDSSRCCPLKKGRNPWGNHGKHGDFTRKMVITMEISWFKEEGFEDLTDGEIGLFTGGLTFKWIW